MKFVNKSTILFTIAILLAFTTLGVALFLFFSRVTPAPPETPFGTPTPVAVRTGIQPDGSYRFTSLEKTKVGATTDDEVERNLKVLSKTTRGDTTIYEVESSIPFTSNEIRTQNGIVIFESTNTETSQAGNPPSISEIEQELGPAEEVLERTGKAWYISAYLYPTKGFALFVNPNTGSVYEIQRFLPMSITAYRQQYGEFIQPAPTPVGELPF